MKRTLKRELKVLEIVEREPIRSPKESAMIQTSQRGFLYSNVYSIFSFVSKARLKEWSTSLLLKTSQHQFNR